MIEGILSRLGGPPEPFPWGVALILLAILIGYGLLEYALGLGLRSLWRRLIRRDEE
jgi:hypothetical protein